MPRIPKKCSVAQLTRSFGNVLHRTLAHHGESRRLSGRFGAHGIDARHRIQRSRMHRARATRVAAVSLHAHSTRLTFATDLIHYQSPGDGSTTPSQHVWSSGFLRCGSDGMKVASTLSPEPYSVYRQLQVGSEYSSFCGAKGRLAH